MTKAQYSALHSDSRGTKYVKQGHRVKVTSGMFLPDSLRDQLPEGINRYAWVAVFLTDSKVHPQPEPITC